MIYEFRLYHVSQGRTAAEVARMVDASVLGAPEIPNGPPAHAETLFARHGVAKPLAAWNALSGPGLPVFFYLQRWASHDQRDRNFPKFWVDPLFLALREKGEEGSPLVERVVDWVMVPSPIWEQFRTPTSEPIVAPLQELVVQHVVPGQVESAREVWRRFVLPRLQEAGAEVIGVFELSVGAGLPAFVLFLAWPELEAQRRGWVAATAAAPAHAEVFAAAERHLLDPLPWGVPRQNFVEQSPP